MTRNVVNILFILLLLIMATACFWSSDRSSRNPPQYSDSSNANVADTQTASSRPAATPQPDKGDFVVENQTASVSRFRTIDDRVRANRLLESAAEKLNRSLILPQDIILRLRTCDEANATYEAKSRSITVCYELLEHFLGIFKKAGETDERAYDKMFDAVRFVFLHEVAHALIDVYDLPITGSEEDAADRLSTFFNLTELGDEGVRAIFAAAEAFRLESRPRLPVKRQLADEHLLQEQRAYNSLCLVYGADPEKYSSIVADGYLPSDRAAGCKKDYQKTIQSWTNLLGPWRKTDRRL